MTGHDLLLILFLAFLECALSVDNALVLALLAKGLPPALQKKALTYGLLGAFAFRFISLFVLSHLISLNWVKFVGATYLIGLALKHLIWESKGQDSDTQSNRHLAGHFWRAVVLIELTDVAFAIDSILAAVALTQKLWIVFLGGILGVVAMRLAATGFLKVLDRFPNFENTAFFMILLIGIKLLLEGLHLPGVQFHSIEHPAFWVFWGLMLACVLLGFRRRDRRVSANSPSEAN